MRIDKTDGSTKLKKVNQVQKPASVAPQKNVLSIVGGISIERSEAPTSFSICKKDAFVG